MAQKIQLPRVGRAKFRGLAEHHARVEGLAGTAERNFGLSAFPMHGYMTCPSCRC